MGIAQQTVAVWEEEFTKKCQENNFVNSPDFTPPALQRVETAIVAWKGGELLAKMEKDKGGSGYHNPAANMDGGSPYARTLEAAKLSESTPKRWQRNTAIGAFLNIDEPSRVSNTIYPP